MLTAPSRGSVPQKDPLEQQFQKASRLMEKGRCKDAFKIFKELDPKGHIPSSFQLGLCLLLKKGTPQNVTEGIALVTKAAEKNYGDALIFLSDIYREGSDGIAKDPQKSFAYQKRAADLGEPMALFNMGCLYDGMTPTDENQKIAFSYYQKAAEKKFIPAYHNTGFCYHKGLGTSLNYSSAKLFYEKAIGLGYAPSMVELATMYIDGLGVLKNPEKGFQLLLKASQLGNAAALYELGICYLNGEGVEQNIQKSIACFWDAAEGKHPLAYFNLFSLYTKGYNLQIDPKNLEAFFRQNAAEPTRENLYLLGAFLITQEGKKKEGKDLITQAAQKGFLYAFYHLGDLSLRENDTEKGLQYLMSASQKGLVDASLMLVDHYARARERLGTLNYLSIAVEQGSQVAKEILDASTQRVSFVEPSPQEDSAPDDEGAQVLPHENPKEEVLEEKAETTDPIEPESFIPPYEESREETFLRPAPFVWESEVPQFLSSVTSKDLKDKEKELSSTDSLTAKTTGLFQSFLEENQKKLKLSDFIELANLINHDLKTPLIGHASTKLGYGFYTFLQGQQRLASTHRMHKKDQKRTGANLNPAFVKGTLTLFKEVFDVYGSKKS
jgi:TPR repeat protein